MDHEHSTRDARSAGRLANLMIVGLVAVAAYFVVGEHWVHVQPYLPLLLFLACPLMHLFMHHGHGHHHHRQPQDAAPSRPDAGKDAESRP